MLTREEYRVSKGLPRRGIGLDHSFLSPNGTISQRERDREWGRLGATVDALAQNDAEFDAMVRRGEAYDPALLAHDAKQRAQRIQTIEGQIRFYRSIGMGKRGKVKPTYQRMIDGFEAELSALRT